MIQCSIVCQEPILFLLNLRFSCQLDSLLQHPCIDLIWESEEYDSPVTYPPIPTTPVCQSRGTAHNVYAMSKTSRTLGTQGRCHLPPEFCNPDQLFNYRGDLSSGHRQAHPRVPRLRFLRGRHIGGTKKILKVFLLSPDGILSRGQ